MNHELIKARIAAGKTQKALAKVTRISLRNYQAYEYAAREPGVYKALRIAKYLHHTVEDLFGKRLPTRDKTA